MYAVIGRNARLIIKRYQISLVLERKSYKTNRKIPDFIGKKNGHENPWENSINSQN